MNIYFAGSIRGGRDDARWYQELVKNLQRYGTVLTEHVANTEFTNMGEAAKDSGFIHSRDLAWLAGSDAVVAEVSTPSLGVGYEIAHAENRSIPTLCLYRERSGFSLSAMIDGSPKNTTVKYRENSEAFEAIALFFSSFTK